MRLSAPQLAALTAPLLLVPLAACDGASAAANQDEASEGWTQAELEAVTAVIQAQVEELREEDYERDVTVKITDREGFIEYASARIAEQSSEAELAAEEDVAKLLGLVPPSMDLWATTFKVLEDQVGGFYDPGSDTFYLMESFTGKVAKIILAHELTHALDDQLYDIDGSLEKVIEDRDAASAYMAVVEGSGTAIMTQWMLKFSEKLTMEETAEAASMGTESLGEAPAYVWKPLLASYTTGNGFLDRGYRIKKKEGLSFSDVTRIAFQSPPRSTEQVLHPEKYWKEGKLDEPQPVKLGCELPEGWKILDESTLGELSLALLTDDSGPVDFSNPMAMAFMKYTNDAAKGWGGDRMLLIGKEGARFLHVASVWDTEKDAQEFRAALEKRLEDWSKDVAGLGEDGGVQLLPADEAAPKRVRFSAWFGVTVEQARALGADMTLE